MLTSSWSANKIKYRCALSQEPVGYGVEDLVTWGHYGGSIVFQWRSKLALSQILRTKASPVNLLRITEAFPHVVKEGVWPLESLYPWSHLFLQHDNQHLISTYNV